MNIRKSTYKDVDLVLSMYGHSRSVMRADGNQEQWVGYPQHEDVEEDIARGVSFIISLDETPIGTFALVPGVEPTYGFIDHGRWIDEGSPYATLHRLAAMPDTSGIAEIAFKYAKERYDHLRVDTHKANRPMHHILEKQGFVYCGTIYMPDGSPRDAYEWWRYDSVRDDLKEYVEREILPQHEQYDTAHQPNHIRRVMARAMLEGKRLKVKGEMVYAAAAMHDIGICEGREEHHLASGRIIRADGNLRQWFTEDEIETIAEAAEDHRASSTTAPRSLLGCIIAEADRDIEPETIVRRTVEYGMSHYPELDLEGHWQRTLEHLHEKYAEGGYMKLWMDDSPNETPLKELRALIQDEERLRGMFEEMMGV